jgi:hypothetical protein
MTKKANRDVGRRKKEPPPEFFTPSALREGAVAVIEKPKIVLRSSIEELASSVIQPLSPSALPFAQTTDKVILIGASIGEIQSKN